MQSQTKEQPSKEAEFQKIVQQERARTIREKYRYRSLRGGWTAAPLLIWLISGAAIFWILHFNNYADPISISICVSTMAVLLAIFTYDNQWRDHLKAKHKIAWESPPPRQMPDYDSEYNYTDSVIEPKLYFVAKIGCYLISVAALGILAILLFSWLGTISIAPTTIIIILLVVIIFNQERGKRR
jgi:hypothetical protein